MLENQGLKCRADSGNSAAEHIMITTSTSISAVEGFSTRGKSSSKSPLDVLFEFWQRNSIEV